MKIEEIVASLPTEWVEEEICRTLNRQHKLSVYQKRLMLDPHEIGLMRLREMHIGSVNFSEQEIMHIGQCSIDRKYIIVGRDHNTWVIVDYSKGREWLFRGHGYVVKGKKVIPLQHAKKGTPQELMDAYECADRSKPLGKMKADEIFSAGKGFKTRKHGQRGGMGFSEMRKTVECHTEKSTRPWKRGERVKMRNENKRNRENTARETRAMAVIRFSKTGLMYKSEPKATKRNCGRVII